MDLENDKCVELIRGERSALLKNVIDRLNTLNEDFYRGHMHIDKDSLKRKIDEIWDNYSFEMKYRALKMMEHRANTKVEEVDETPEDNEF